VTGRRLVSLLTGIVLSAAVVAGATAAGIVGRRRRRENAHKVAVTREVIERLAQAARTVRARGLALPATVSMETSGSLALLVRASADGLSVVEGSSGALGRYG
jgi:hypothetical protein